MGNQPTSHLHTTPSRYPSHPFAITRPTHVLHIADEITTCKPRHQRQLRNHYPATALAVTRPPTPTHRPRAATQTPAAFAVRASPHRNGRTTWNTHRQRTLHRDAETQRRRDADNTEREHYTQHTSHNAQRTHAEFSPVGAGNSLLRCRLGVKNFRFGDALLCCCSLALPCCPALLCSSLSSPSIRCPLARRRQYLRVARAAVWLRRVAAGATLLCRPCYPATHPHNV